MLNSCPAWSWISAVNPSICSQFLAVPVQFIRIDADPFEFHVGQNLDQGHLHGLEQFIRCDLGQPGPEYLPQLKGDVGVFAGIFCDGFRGQMAMDFWALPAFPIKSVMGIVA